MRCVIVYTAENYGLTLIFYASDAMHKMQILL